MHPSARCSSPEQLKRETDSAQSLEGKREKCVCGASCHTLFLLAKASLTLGQFSCAAKLCDSARWRPLRKPDPTPGIVAFPFGKWRGNSGYMALTDERCGPRG